MSLHTGWNCHSATHICSGHGYVLASSSIGCVWNVTPFGRTNFFFEPFSAKILYTSYVHWQNKRVKYNIRIKKVKCVVTGLQVSAQSDLCMCNSQIRSKRDDSLFSCFHQWFSGCGLMRYVSCSFLRFPVLQYVCDIECGTQSPRSKIVYQQLEMCQSPVFCGFTVPAFEKLAVGSFAANFLLIRVNTKDMIILISVTVSLHKHCLNSGQMEERGFNVWILMLYCLK